VCKLETKASSFSPAHITGFFQIFDRSENSLFKGSRGAGVSLTRGVKTTVRAQKSEKNAVEIRINGRITEKALVSATVAEAFLSSIGAKYQIQVEHEVEVPIGCGLGSSGAGALGLAFVLNEALGLKLSKLEAAQVAHMAEVKWHTGLGTVIAETFGGMEMRVKPGAPGIGEVKPIKVDDVYRVVCLTFGPMSTRKALADPKLRRLINKNGGKLVDELARRPTVSRFLELSRSFAESTSLMTDKVKKVLADADDCGFIASMAIFGETAFSVVKQNYAEQLLRVFRKHARSEHAIINAEIDVEGARILQ
jgi:pantoate kinase